MAGGFNFNKFSKFLKSFWGILASFSVVLPTIIYFSNTSHIKDSVLSEFYIGIPTSFALLSIPFVFLYEDKLSSLVKVRKTSIILIVVSFISLFSFLAIKSLFVKDMKYSYTEDMQVIRVSTSQKGEILTERFNSINDDRPFREEKAVNILEYCSLMLFTISVIFLTTAFSGLGVFFYTKSANS